MGKKQKETEALIVERNREIEALARRVRELEDVITSYKEREESIVEAITSAIDTKSAMIKDATTQSKKILDDANSRAGEMRANAKLTATQTREDAEKIMENARREAAKIVESAQAEAKRRLDEAEKTASECERSYAQVSAGLMDMAQKLNDFIEMVRSSFDMAQVSEGKGTEALIRPTGNGAEVNAATPSDLYHSIMEIQGRTPAVKNGKKNPTPQKKNPRWQKNRQEKGTESAMPELPKHDEMPKQNADNEQPVNIETFEGSLLSTDDITDGIKNISSISDTAESEKLEAIVREVIPD